MKKTIRSLALLLVFALLAGLFAGCGKVQEFTRIEGLKDPGADKVNAPQAMGQFVEVEFPLPQGQWPKAMTTLTTGELRVALSNDDGTAYVSTTGSGRTDWAQTMTLPLQIEGGVSVEGVALSPTGDIFYSTRKEIGDGTYEFHFWLVTADGEAREIPITYPDFDNTKGLLAYNCGFTDSGKLRILFDFQDLREVDLETGAVSENLNDVLTHVRTLDFAGEDSYLLSMQGEVAVCNGEGSQRFTGVMADQLTASVQAMEGNEPKIALWQNPDGYVFFTTQEGLFSYIPGGSIVEELVSGGRSSLGNPSFTPMALTGAEDGTFYVLGGLNGRAVLYRYGYDASVPTSGFGGTIRVYSLYDYEGYSLRQIINQFQIAHPEATVELEIGLTGEDGITEADTMRILNTQILAGDGPDVINLDGFHLETFLEKDLLMDLSGTLNQGEPLLDQIVRCYEADGKVCAVPTFFNIPVIYGPEPIISQIHDLDSLVAALTQAKGESEGYKSLISGYMPEHLGDRLYDSCSAAWMNPDGSLSEEKLVAFYAALEAIYALDGDFRQYLADTNADMDEEYWFAYGEYTGITGGPLVAERHMYMDFGNTTYAMREISGCLQGQDQLENHEIAMLNAQAPNSFLPRQVMGVLTTSENAALAKQFIGFMLSDVVQKKPEMLTGFPVNQVSFDRQINEQGANFGWDNFGEIVYPDAAHRQMLKGWVETLTTPALTDTTIRTMVMDQVRPCCNGEITPEEAAQNALSSLNLYLAE